MNKRLKSIVLALVCVMMVGVLGGCASKFDAVKYVEAVLEGTFYNDPTKYVEMKIATKEEVTSEYEAGIDEVVQALLSGATASDELKAEYKNMITDLFKCAKYTVKSAKMQEDKTFTVEVECQKCKVFGPAMEKFAAISEEEAAALTEQEDILKYMLDCFNAAIADAQYDEAETISIKLVLNDNVYSIDSKDMETLNTKLFDFQ
ncbi:MAG: hypothetical protein IIW54_16240 [Lachnospiraceae bacterium]|nr:hypothetical protein [Lachnospiraceae bacterium]MBQ5852339.1 hypothetical protein [Lachnospiraceae bacterium]MEE0918441.1 hypothetical protein [Lachnospiraceae bacterium]